MVVLDIETFCQIDSLSIDDYEYLRGRKDYSSEEDFHRELFTNPYVSHLVSFAMLFPQENRAMVCFLSDEDELYEEDYSVDGRHLRVFYRSIKIHSDILPSEKSLLELFWEKFSNVDHIITFHGKDFDMEFLKIRTILLQLKPPSFFLYFHSKNKGHIDLKDFLRVGRSNFSLNFLARRFNLPIDKGHMDGSKIGDLFLSGQYRKIAEYNLRDVFITGMLYERLKEYIYGDYVVNLLCSAGFKDGKSLVEYALDKDLLTSKEASSLIDMCKNRGATGKQMVYLRDLVRDNPPDIRDVSSLLSPETILRIIDSISEEEIT